MLYMWDKATQMSYTCKTLFLPHHEFQVKVWMVFDTHNVYFQNSPASDFQERRLFFPPPDQQVIVMSDGLFFYFYFQDQQQHLTKLSNIKVTFQSLEHTGTQFKYAEGYTANPHHCH